MFGSDCRMVDPLTKDCRSVAETEAFAADFAARLAPGTFVGLIGPLGAGKSVFARAVGRHWGVTETMPSPTFTLMAAYDGDCPVYHMDLYRITSAAELESADLITYFAGDGICLVEWAERAREFWPVSGWIVTCAIADQQTRRIAITNFGTSTDIPGHTR